jgi:hypothetical protein
MAFFHSDARKILCVLCKRCHRNVPAGVQAAPLKYIAVNCILCGESRLYLPTEVGLDYPHHEVMKRMGAAGTSFKVIDERVEWTVKIESKRLTGKPD